ncbi:hypothetical protein HanRHA438_Chr09g0403951 [Helianthus annuus]|nr:hypothetical protein HanRHA438_Chr09g0403951 [Helianthus annuus]
MCELCGGPHFTVKCPQYEGSSVDYYTNSFVQPHLYFSQEYSSYQYEESYQQPQQQNFGVNEQDQLDRIMGLLAQLVATDETTQKMIQEHEVLLQNQQSILSDIRCSVEEMSRKLEEVEETEKKGIIDFGCEEDEFTMQVANCGIVRENEVEFEVEKKVLSWEDEFLGELEGLSESK